MEVIVVDSAEAVSREGAARFASALADEPALAAAIATGNSPLGLYAQLAGMQRAGAVDAHGMTAFQLDDYLGIGADDPRSLWGWMQRAFVVPLGLADDRVCRLDAMAADPETECARYDQAIVAAGGLGLAVLGLGPNGHLGFNEPPCAPDAPTRPVDLSPESVASNAAYWGGRERVPPQALTMGMAALLAARRVLLVVSGPHKHAILRRTVEEEPSVDLPAAWLQRHPGATVIADRAAWEGTA